MLNFNFSQSVRASTLRNMTPAQFRAIVSARLTISQRVSLLVAAPLEKITDAQEIQYRGIMLDTVISDCNRMIATQGAKANGYSAYFQAIIDNVH